MSDDKTKILVPEYMVSEPGTWGRMRSDIAEWLETYVSGNGGYYCWSSGPEINGVKHSSFSFSNVPNQVRKVFAESLGGTLVFEKKNLLKKDKDGSWTVYVPEKNVTNEHGNRLTDETVEWLRQSINAEGGSWCWSMGMTQDDIKYCSFSFSKVEEEVIVMFKMMFS